MSWDEARKAIENAAAGGEYVKLKNDNDKAIIAIAGEPQVKRMVWGKDQKSYDVASAEGKELIASGEKVKTRFEIKVLELDVKDAKGNPLPPEEKLLDMNAATLASIDQARIKFPPEVWAYELRRKGVANNPKMVINVLPDRKLTDEERKLIGDVIPF